MKSYDDLRWMQIIAFGINLRIPRTVVRSRNLLIVILGLSGGTSGFHFCVFSSDTHFSQLLKYFDCD